MTGVAIAALVSASCFMIAVVMSFISIYFEEKERDKLSSRGVEDASKYK
jgi:hypothetical protein